MAAPSPSGWLIQNADASAFSFKSTVNGVNSLSDQALVMDAGAFPEPVILPDKTPGNISETRVEFALIDEKLESSAVGIVFAFQDIDNYLAVETRVRAGSDKIEQLTVSEKVNGSVSNLKTTGTSLSIDPSAGWVDIRIQVFRPSNSEVSFRVSAADHGEKFQALATTTFSDSQLAFTSGDVGLTGGHDFLGGPIGIDGDAVGSGGRPIKMYWA